jgi:hypothetical protein
MNDRFTFNGCLWGIGLYIFLFSGLGIIFIHIFGGDGIKGLIVGFFGIVMPLAGGGAISEHFSKYDKGDLTVEEIETVIRYKRLIWAYIVSFIGLNILIDDFHLVEGINSTFTQIITPLLLSIFLVLVVPPFYRFVLNTISGDKSNDAQEKSSWFKNKVLAPILVSVCTGAITYLITGEYNATTGVTLVTIPISWFAKINVNLEA